MPLKRPVTVAQARRWPASAKRRESFCARMGGMRERLTSPEVAADPASAINRSLAAWDCDDPEGLRPEHVSKGIRMKVTMSKVGSETRGRAKSAQRNPKMTPRQQVTRWSKDMGLRVSSGDGFVFISDPRSEWSETFDDWPQAMEWARKAYDAKRDEGKPWPWDVKKNPAPAKKTPARSAAPKVWSVFADRAENPVAMFRTREDAVTFAQARANTTGKQMRVSEE